MNVNFRMEYLPLAKAVTLLDEATASYQEIRGKLEAVRVTLHDQDCVGDTGTAISEVILELENRLSLLSTHSQNMRTALHDTIGDIRDVIDAKLIGKASNLK
ncbi:MAG: hypothetical protein HY866_21850 [Chloroflexi bacterium]|nr:hypothetical protein [Chloroflexota bacterium]